MFSEKEVTKYIVDLTMSDGAKPIGFNVFMDRNDAIAFSQDVIVKNQKEGIRCFIREHKSIEIVYESTTDRPVSDVESSSVQ